MCASCDIHDESLGKMVVKKFSCKRLRHIKVRRLAWDLANRGMCMLANKTIKEEGRTLNSQNSRSTVSILSVTFFIHLFTFIFVEHAFCFKGIYKNILFATRQIVCYTAVISVLTQRSSPRCVTTLITAV